MWIVCDQEETCSELIKRHNAPTMHPKISSVITCEKFVGQNHNWKMTSCGQMNVLKQIKKLN